MYQKNEKTRDAWVKKVLFEMPSGLRMLDAGAGSGRYREFCSHLEYVSQDICEYDGAGDKRGLQTGTPGILRVDIKCDIVNIPEPNSSFDIILCTEVFEHIPDPIAAIQEFSRLLRTDGFLILTAPFCSLTHYSPYHYYSGFSRYFYEKFLVEKGFEILSITANGCFFEYLLQEVTRIKEMVARYTDVRLNSKKGGMITAIHGLLEGLRDMDKGSHELLCFGYHVLAKKL